MTIDAQAITPATLSPTQPAYWSVRRELWENRSIYLAPLAVAAMFMFGFLISSFTLSRRMRAAALLDAAKQRAAVTLPFNFAAGLILMTAFIVGVLYSLDALNGERRDRSILFWKSLPISDRTTVLSKASIPMVVLPIFIFPVIVMMQTIMLMLSSVALLGNAPGLSMLWTHEKFIQSTVALLYALIVVALWHAPIYGWLLLVSAWAKHGVFLWALLPMIAVTIFERIAFGSRYFYLMLGHRMTGWLTQGFDANPSGLPIDPVMALAPGKLLSSPGLWFGLLFAAACLIAAMRLRRYKEPI